MLFHTMENNQSGCVRVGAGGSCIRVGAYTE